MKKSIMYKVIIIIIELYSLVATTGILDGNFNLQIFRMFTTLINLCCFIYYIIDVIYIHFYKKEFSLIIKQSILFSMILTFIIVVFVLRMGFGFSSYMYSSLLGLHFIVPIMVLMDYLLFTKKGQMPRKDPIIYAILPIVYFIFTILTVKLGLFNTYPYQFIDINSLGLMKVLMNTIIILFIYLIFGYLFYLFDQFLSKNHSFTLK